MVYTAGGRFQPILLYEEAVMFKALYCGRRLKPFVLGGVFAGTLTSAFALQGTEDDSMEAQSKEAQPLLQSTTHHSIDFVNEAPDRWLLVAGCWLLVMMMMMMMMDRTQP